MNAADASYAEVQELQKWELSGCPVSTNDIVLTGAAESTVIFETRGRIVEWQYPDGQQQIIAETVTGTRQKNPSFAIDASGRRLVVWGEATSYAKGGALNMRLIDKDGSVREVKHNEIEMPDFSFPATAVLPDETFWCFIEVGVVSYDKIDTPPTYRAAKPIVLKRAVDNYSR